MLQQAPLSALHQARGGTRTQVRLAAAYPRAKLPRFCRGGFAHFARARHAVWVGRRPCNGSAAAQFGRNYEGDRRRARRVGTASEQRYRGGPDGRAHDRVSPQCL